MEIIKEYEEVGTFSIEIDGVVFELPRFCPHRAGRLDHGQINTKTKTVSCPLHKSVFSLIDGKQIAGPECGQIAVNQRPVNSTT